MNYKSKRLYSIAKKLMPGGVNSPVRAFGSVDLDPIFIEKGKGSKIYDVDGNKYIDYVCSWGPLILGHLPEVVISALKEASRIGTSFGAPTELENEMAELLIDIFPSIEMIRMVNSGTEANLSAIRLARGCTGRKIVVKFEGCYHGHVDSLLVKAGSGGITFGVPDSSGVPEELANLTITLPYNDIDLFRKTMEKNGNDVACVIVEPIAGNMGVIPPINGFLEILREMCTKFEALLVFDEVISGLRVELGGAQKLYKIQPDITTLGKIIGGGLPVGAYGGSKKIMKHISPLGSVYQAGTLSGNPLALLCGISTIKFLKNNYAKVYKKLDQLSKKLEEGYINAAKKSKIKLKINRVGSMMGIFFTDRNVLNLKDALSSDKEMFKFYFKELLQRKIYIAPSPFESMFLSYAHSEGDINITLKSVEEVFKKYGTA